MLCQDVSTLPPGIAGTLRNIPLDLIVYYDGAAYYPLYLEIKFKQGKHYNVAVLHSLKVNSTVHAPLDKVTVKVVNQ